MNQQASNLYKFLFFAAFSFSLYLFLSQDVDSGVRFPHADKVGHLIIFVGLTLLFDLGFNASQRVTLALAFFYGGAVELVQGILPARQASLGDLAADLAGTLCYLLIVRDWLRAQLKTRTLL